jgi:hypothetical protein
MESSDWGAAGFWIFIAALVVGGMWSDTRKKAEKHATLRWIVEKTGSIDEAKLKQLFDDESSAEQKPGYTYRGLRISGVVVMFAGAGIATFFLVAALMAMLFDQDQMFIEAEGLIGGIAASAGVMVLGLGLFLSSRFATPPVDSRNDSPAR